MNFEEKYTPEKISVIKNLSENVFLGNYLETGILESSKDIRSRIKTEVTSSLIDFYGQEHGDSIRAKVDKTPIIFCVQAMGPINCISNGLEEIKVKNFNTQCGMNCDMPSSFSTFLKTINKNADNLDALFVDADRTYSFKNCCAYLGVNPDDLKTDNSLRRLFISQVRELGTKWDSMVYSNNSEIQTNMLMLEEYCNDVLLRIVQDLMNQGVSDEDITKMGHDMIYKNYGALRYDPLVQKDVDYDMYRKCSLEAYVNRLGVFIGTNPTDDTIIHEFIHIITNNGLEAGHMERRESEYVKSMTFREYEMLNEVITDYFTLKIFRDRQIKGAPTIIKEGSVTSNYSRLFDIVGPFIDSYLPEITESCMRKCPAEEMMRVMGQDAFDSLATLCNEIISIPDIDLIELKEFESELSHEDYDKIIKETALRSDMVDMAGNITDNAISDQSMWRRFISLVYVKSDEIVNKIHTTNNPTLKKVARILYSVPETMKRIMDHEKGKMGEPFDTPGDFISNEAENDFVMEMKPPTIKIDNN